MARLDRPWDALAARTGRPIGEIEWQDALLHHRVVEEEFDSVRYFRTEKDFERLPRGTILADEGLLHEYPHLPRILHLARGLARSFDGPFHIEEKIDGYNVRIARFGGRALAFSRGGYVCPFATDRLEEHPEIDRFLAAHPRLVLCVEVAGPGNPYNIEHPPYVAEDVRFFTFDLLELDSGRFLAPPERASLLAAAGIEAPRTFGTALPNEVGRLYDVVRRLDAEGCEGICLKSTVEGGPRVKYVTLGADIRDLAATSGVLGSIPRAFLVNRLVQAAFTLHELGHGAQAPPPPEVSRRVGEAILAPMLESIRAVEAGGDPERHPGEVDETYTIRMREERNVDRLLRHLDRSSATVQVKLLEKAREPDGRWRVRFAKRYQKAAGYFLSRLVGQTFID